MNLNPSPDQNRLLDDSGKVVAEFVEAETDEIDDTCKNGCVCFYDCIRSDCSCYMCQSSARKDGKNGYWKEIDNNE